MAFTIKKNYRDPHRVEKEKAYRYLASLGIQMPALDHPEDLFYMSVPADADVYDEYAGAIARRIGKIRDRLGSLQTPQEKYERNFLAILSANALAFSFNHKLPQETELALMEYLATLWSKSKLAGLLKKINLLPPDVRGDLILLSELGEFDKEAFHQKEYEHSTKIKNKSISETPKGLTDIIEEGTKAANTAKHLYNYLYNKADWQNELDQRSTSYDRDVSKERGENSPILLRDTLVGATPDEIFDSIDQKADIARIHTYMNKLPPGMCDAVQKFFDGKPLTATERKAKVRGVAKLKAWMSMDKPQR